MKAAVIGCGAWGTALANCLCKNGFDTVLWCHDAALAEDMLQKGVNPMLEGVALNSKLRTSTEAECVRGCDLVVIATSSVFVRSSSRMVAPYLGKDTVVATVVKGVESGTMLRMSQIVEEETGHTVVALTGPSHAEEVGREMPTGCLAACQDQEKAEFVQKAFCNDAFRIYVSDDIVGAELGGALKNIIALCAGVVDGLGYGDLESIVLRDRKQLSEDGIAVVVLGMSGRTGEITSGPDIISRGLVYANEDALIKEAKQTIIDSINSAPEKQTDWSIVKNDVRKVLGNFFFRKTKRRPMILTIVIEN